MISEIPKNHPFHLFAGEFAVKTKDPAGIPAVAVFLLGVSPDPGNFTGFVIAEKHSKNTTAKPAALWPTLLRRYCFILIMGAWMGGFTFYALVVIPTAGKVLGGERDVGFITQQVTQWLNLIGVAALLFLGWNLAVEWLWFGARSRFGLAVTWSTMAVAQTGLFITHPFIDRLLDVQSHKIHGHGHFDALHQVYLIFATVQWVAAMLHIWQMLIGWRSQDHGA